MKNTFLAFLFFILILNIYTQNALARPDKVYGTNPANDPRRGTVYYWTDPQTGDRITSVQPGKKEQLPPGQHTNPPIYVYPEITPQHKPWPKPRSIFINTQRQKEA